MFSLTLFCNGHFRVSKPFSSGCFLATAHGDAMQVNAKNPFLSMRRRADSKNIKMMKTMSARIIFLWFMALVFIHTAGCAERPLENAFKGEYSTAKNNKVINEYCKSCHIHKNFDPESHVQSVRSDYKRTYFRNAKECRACHYLEKDWVTNSYNRKTRSPLHANRGAFRDFERTGLREMKNGASGKEE